MSLLILSETNKPYPISLPPLNCTHHKGDKHRNSPIRLSMAVSLTSLGAGQAYATISVQLKERKLEPAKQSLVVLCQESDSQHRRFITQKHHLNIRTLNRRDAIRLIGLAAGLCNDLSLIYDARGAGLPPQGNAKLCDTTCEKELENAPMVTTESGLQYKDIKIGDGPSPPIGFQVAANYVAMVSSGQVFDSSLDKGQPYIFRVGSGQVIKGLDEGLLSMKVGGKRRLYIPGPLAFPKGLNSAPGRPRVAPNSPVIFDLAFPKGLNSAPGRPRVAPSSPVIFDVSLEYIPGLELELEEE